MERMKIDDSATAVFPWDIHMNYDVIIFQNVNIKLNPCFIATIHTIHLPDMSVLFKTGVQCFHCPRAKVNTLFNSLASSIVEVVGKNAHFSTVEG